MKHIVVPGTVNGNSFIVEETEVHRISEHDGLCWPRKAVKKVEGIMRILGAGYGKRGIKKIRFRRRIKRIKKIKFLRNNVSNLSS